MLQCLETDAQGTSLFPQQGFLSWVHVSMKWNGVFSLTPMLVFFRSMHIIRAFSGALCISEDHSPVATRTRVLIPHGFAFFGGYPQDCKSALLWAPTALVTPGSASGTTASIVNRSYLAFPMWLPSSSEFV